MFRWLGSGRRPRQGWLCPRWRTRRTKIPCSHRGVPHSIERVVADPPPPGFFPPDTAAAGARSMQGLTSKGEPAIAQ